MKYFVPASKKIVLQAWSVTAVDNGFSDTGTDDCYLDIVYATTASDAISAYDAAVSGGQINMAGINDDGQESSRVNFSDVTVDAGWIAVRVTDQDGAGAGVCTEIALQLNIEYKIIPD